MNKLVLELLADNSDLLRGLDRAQSAVKNFTGSASTMGSTMGGGVNRALDAFSGLAKGGAAAAGVLAGGLSAAAVGAVLLTVSTAAQVEALDHVSMKTGIALQTLQGYSVIMGENNFEAQQLTAGMRTLSKIMVEARDPASAAAATLDEMGLSITSLGSTDAVMRAVADRFRDMPDGADKARIAVTLFGKSGLDLIPMLNKGAQAFDESRAASQRFGLVLTSTQVSALNAADDATDRLGLSLQGLKTQLAVTFAPGVAKWTDAVTEGIAKITRAVIDMREESERTAASKGPMGKGFDPMDGIKAMVPGSSLIESAARVAAGPPKGGAAGPLLTDDQKQHVMDQIQGEQQAHIDAIERVAMKNRDAMIWDERRKAIMEKINAEMQIGVDRLHEQEKAERNLHLGFQAEAAAAAESATSGNVPAMAITPEMEHRLQLAQELQQHFVATGKAALTLNEALTILNANEEQGAAIQAGLNKSYVERFEVLENASAVADAYAQNQAAVYQQEGALLGSVDAARQAAFDAQDRRRALELARYDEQLRAKLISQETYNAKLQQLELKADTERRQTVQQFPTFFEQQMQSLVNSNTFSVGQIVSSWTSGMANAIVTTHDFQAMTTQAWQATQVAIVQGLLNAGVQMAAVWALNASVEMGILTATEAARMGLKTASNATIVAGEAATAGATVGIWGAAGTAIMGMWGTITGAFSAMAATMVGILTAVGTFVMGVLGAIAEALTATVFGIPWAGAILLGVALIAGALAMTGNLGFKDGGIGDFGAGTPATLHGKEAIIPLNGRGAAFMAEAFAGMGGGMGGSLTVPVILDGREIGRAVVNNLPTALRRGGLPL